MSLSPPTSGSIDWLTTASANVIASSRIGCCGLAERVAGDRVLQPDDGDDVAGRGRSRLLPAAGRVGVDVEQLGDVLLHVLAGVVRPHVRLQHAGVDADEEPVPVRVPRGLEHQAAERLLRVGLALLLLVRLLRVRADDRRPVERAGQVVRHRVEQRLNADVLAAASRTAPARSAARASARGSVAGPSPGRGPCPSSTARGDQVLVVVLRSARRTACSRYVFASSSYLGGDRRRRGSVLPWSPASKNSAFISIRSMTPRNGVGLSLTEPAPMGMTTAPAGRARRSREPVVDRSRACGRSSRRRRPSC